MTMLPQESYEIILAPKFKFSKCIYFRDIQKRVTGWISISELFSEVEKVITRKRSGYIAAKPPQSVTSETGLSCRCL
jgi:hypothetical protein